MADFVTIAQVEAKTLVGYVDWDEVESKLLPARRPSGSELAAVPSAGRPQSVRSTTSGVQHSLSQSTL
jgi:hypothetical protein